MRLINFGVKAILALAICSPGFAVSAELLPDDTAPLASGLAEQTVVTSAAPTSAKVEPASAVVMEMGPALAGDQLEKYRGGTDTVSNDMTLSGTVARNSASEVVTGANTINGAAFTNTSGFATVIQNSGANVLIQSATIVNVQFK